MIAEHYALSACLKDAVFITACLKDGWAMKTCNLVVSLLINLRDFCTQHKPYLKQAQRLQTKNDDDAAINAGWHIYLKAI